MSWLRISASEALTLLAQDDATVFDVRDSAAYQAGHLAKAANLAMERIPAWSKRLNKDAPALEIILLVIAKSPLEMQVRLRLILRQVHLV
jgi:rhodanese-related sulfurtransferase